MKVDSLFLAEYNLEIRDAHLEDDAAYQCQLLQTASQEGHISNTVRLTVLGKYR